MTKFVIFIYVIYLDDNRSRMSDIIFEKDGWCYLVLSISVYLTSTF